MKGECKIIAATEQWALVIREGTSWHTYPLVHPVVKQMSHLRTGKNLKRSSQNTSCITVMMVIADQHLLVHKYASFWEGHESAQALILLCHTLKQFLCTF